MELLQDHFHVASVDNIRLLSVASSSSSFDYMQVIKGEIIHLKQKETVSIVHKACKFD